MQQVAGTACIAGVVATPPCAQPPLAGHTEVRRNRRLAIKFIATIGEGGAKFGLHAHMGGISVCRPWRLSFINLTSLPPLPLAANYEYAFQW